MNEQSRSSSAVTGESTAPKSTDAKAVAGPLTIRDLTVLGAVVIIFVASLIPLVKELSGSSLWHISGLFYIGVGVVLPLAVGVLFLVRRMSPATKIRFGSLSIDQFGSVVAAFATYFFFTGTVTNFTVPYLIGLIGSLLLLVGTVCAQWIPVFAADFTGRVEALAHVAARDAVPAVKRPAAPKPVVAQAGSGAQAFGQQYAPGAPVQGGPARFAPGQQGGAAQGGPAQGGTAQGGAVQGGWNATPVTNSHTQGGQIFTPAKDNSPGAGFGAGAAAGAAASAVNEASPAAAAANTGHNPIATPFPDAAAKAEPTTDAVLKSDPAAHPAANTAANPAANTAAQPPVEAASPAEGEPAQPKEAVATTLNPQVAQSAKPGPAAETQAAPVVAKESITATVNPAAPAPVAAEPFWFAVDRPQNVIDEKSRQFAFKLAPGAWILALEDRGSSFLVQDSHGKTGLLLDLGGIERASDSQ